jgi:hypothetical protein
MPLGSLGLRLVTRLLHASVPAASGINAYIDYQTTQFSFPTNFPFQSYSARWPVPVSAAVHATK